jgi:hypothetical protein
MIHFIYVILETDAYYYSAYLDLLDSLHACFPSPTSSLAVSIFWDGENNKESIIHQYYRDKLYKTQIPKSMNISGQILHFIHQSYSQIKADRHVLCLYVHGNIWFLRHSGKILPFSDILSNIQVPFDILCLESCYSATIENCLECYSWASYLISSEGPHSKCIMLNPHCISVLCKTPTQAVRIDALARFLAQCFMYKINSYAYRDNQLLELGCDISVINLQAFRQQWNRLRDLSLNNQPDDVYRKSKVHPKRRPADLGYDVYSTIMHSNLSNQQKEEFQQWFYTIVIFYQQSKRLQEKRYASRSHGLSWSPAPYDSEQGWTYKLTQAFLHQEELTIYK